MQNNLLQQLFSERLIYVPMNQSFANEQYVHWLNDVEVNKYLEVPKYNTLTDLKNYIANTESSKTYFWAIVIKENNKHIGNIKIDPINTKHQYGEYGIMMGNKDEWGKGYAKEASITILDFCFKKLNLRKVNLGVVKANTAALELYKKLNFIIEGEYKNHCIYDGEYHNIIRMACFNPSINY